MQAPNWSSAPAIHQQWANMYNINAVKLKQLHEDQPSLILLFTPIQLMTFLLRHVKLINEGSTKALQLTTLM